jgi:redox-sensitive bicupin YhaK (pirin superfamily)
MRDGVVQVVPVTGMHWPTVDPFLFCAHHDDRYPPGNEAMGPAAPLTGRAIGQDFASVDGWNMYHGLVVPGFPQHPHRGFETVTFARHGFIDHSDSLGAMARFGRGDVQWMTAGRGIVHSEMPRAEAGEDLWGLQLWVNLPAAEKMMRPRYQELGPADIPEVDHGDGRVRVVAGAVGGRRGPVDGIRVAPTMIDVTLPAGGALRHELPGHHAAFAYVLAGAAELGRQGVRVPEGQLAVFGPGREVVARAPGGARFLLLAAAPIGEPVARRGPFVMNTEAELDQAVADYQSGRLVGG